MQAVEVTIDVVGGEHSPEAEQAADRPRRRRVLGLYLAAGWLVLMVFLAIFATILPFQDPLGLNPGRKAEVMSWDHWLGTDNLSRDILSRIANGARVSLLVGFVSAGLAAVVGSLLGLLAGYYRRWTETLIMG